MPSAGANAGSGDAAAAAKGITLPTDFDAFYKSFPDVSEAQFLVDIGYLKSRKLFGDMERAIAAYLANHSKHAAPWMYEMLGVAKEANKRDAESIRMAYGWGAYLARQSQDPVALIAASDALLLHKYDEIPLPGKSPIRLNEMLDQAMKAAPHRAEPILMAMLRAEQIQDAPRMADATERLLCLGWPGNDDAWRIGADRRVRALAQQLKDAGKPDPAKLLLDRLPEIEARDVVVRLSWDGDAGLELNVEEPLGATADHFNPRTVFGGTLVREGRPPLGESLYTCPRGYDGEYVARIKILYNDEKKPVRTARLQITTHEGTPQEHAQTASIDLGRPEPVRFNLSDGRRQEVLPYESLPRLLNDRVGDGKPDASRTAPARPKP